MAGTQKYLLKTGESYPWQAAGAPGRHARGYLRRKRSLDIAGAIVIALLVLLPILFITILLRLSSGRPLLFSQWRIGCKGEPFRIYKFATMSVREEGDRVRVAVENDARVTRIGRLLRKFSLDELPQLWNVLRGDMSLVGPRPLPTRLSSQLAELLPEFNQRYTAKPGIVGPAQLSHLRNVKLTRNYAEQLLFCDLDYLRHCSLHTDTALILRSIGYAFQGRGI